MERGAEISPKEKCHVAKFAKSHMFRHFGVHRLSTNAFQLAEKSVTLKGKCDIHHGLFYCLSSLVVGSDWFSNLHKPGRSLAYLQYKFNYA